MIPPDKTVAKRNQDGTRQEFGGAAAASSNALNVRDSGAAVADSRMNADVQHTPAGIAAHAGRIAPARAGD
ncbi:MAG: hypothetical protein IPO58_00515 [Betaproteobacteria bacterium]|nr:hypothetical protein [Betaproteobacteria bacterium]